MAKKENRITSRLLLSIEYMDEEGMTKIKIKNPGRGTWKRMEADGCYAEMFLGFEGEDQLTICRSSMQSGQDDIVLVFSPVDGTQSVHHKCVDFCDVEGTINEMLRQVEKEIGCTL